MKKHLLHISYFFLCLCTASGVFGQERYQASKVVPPSPTAASLGKYGDLPVGYYSGNATTTIPLHDVKISDNSLPVKLTYTSTGTKVGENASWVGLGWTLSAGGAITRTIRGMDDLGNNGYYNAGPLPPNNGKDYIPGGNWTTDKQYFDNVQRGALDAEPDIFQYNFGNYTGRFSIGKKADGSKIFMDERNNLKVEYLPSGFSWIVTDGQGYRYYFNTRETATEYTYSSTSGEISDNAGLSDFRRIIQGDVTTAWYLDSIVAPTADRIKFTYASKSHSVTSISKSEKMYNMLELLGGCSGTPSATYKYYNANRQVVYDMYLEQIVFDQGTITFNTTDREDVEYIDANKPDKLSEIIVKNYEDKVVKRFLLSYSYFNTGSDRRLRLDSVTEYGSSGQAKPPHKFTYFGGDNIPPRYIKSIDHWGYYNNQGNNTLLPAMTVAVYDKVFAGANRESDTDEDNLKRGVLSSIVYPTGGVTRLDYELNDYSNLTGDDRYTKVLEGVQVYSHDGDPWNHIRASFDIVGDTQTVTVRFNYDKADATAPDNINPNLQVVYAYVYKDGQQLISYSNFSRPGGTAMTGGGDDIELYYPGHYVIEVRHIQGYVTSMGANYDKKVLIRQRQGGGLRIKSIINYENGNKTNVRKFLYTDGDSTSGRLITKPAYATFLEFEGIGDFGSCRFNVKYLGRESASVIPAGLSYSSCPIGYSKVTEQIGENGEGGKIEYYYHNTDDVYSDAPFIPAYHDPLNGKLKTSIVYNAAGEKIKKSDYTNLAKEIYPLWGVKLYTADDLPLPPQDPRFTELTYSIRYYQLESSWFPLQSETTTEYANGESLVTRKEYNYENFDNKEVTWKEETRSDNKTITTKYKYPGDYPSAGSGSFVNRLKEKHIISPVIEEQAFVDDGNGQKLIAGKFTEYRENKGSISYFFKPAIEYKLVTEAPLNDLTGSSIGADNIIHLHPNYKPEVYFDRYGDFGNLETYHEVDNAFNSYVWDYKSSLPIAQIENAAFTDIAYTSFEAEQKGNWSFSGTPAADATAPTGKRSYSLASGAISRTGLQSGKSYMLSYWTKNAGAYSIAGTQSGYPVKAGAVNGWTNYIHKITGVTSVTFPASGAIDELRLYPGGAQMTTYTYDPLIGMTGRCDAKGELAYYVYDEYGRLMLIKDQFGKILKQYDYQYQKPVTQ